MGRKRATSVQPLFEKEHGYAYCREHKLCAECGSKLEGRRTRWCSDECVNTALIRSDPSFARHCVENRDRGVCAHCSIDTLALREQIREADKRALEVYRAYWIERLGHDAMTRGQWHRKAGRLNADPREHSYAWFCREERISVLEPIGFERWWWRKTFFDVDHVQAFSEGGDQCDLSNLQTLCVLCHSERTARQARRRSRGGPVRVVRRPWETQAEYESRVLGRRRAKC